MIIKKLAVPFINEKLLQQVEHCYIATAAISEAGFDFIRSRIPTKTKMEIVTGLDVPTSPEVLKRIWKNYQGRISLNIYTRNFFHANTYIFDLPFRKSVAFVGSGHCTLEGLKDGEELFYKITDAKEIENLKSWFIGYHEFAEPLNEALIQEYEWLYPTLKERDRATRAEKKQFLSLTTAGFSWDQLKLKNHYFQKEDYLTFANNKARFDTPELQEERKKVQTKLLTLHEQLKDHLGKLKLIAAADPTALVSSLDPKQHVDRQLRSMWLSYGSSANVEEGTHMRIQIDQNCISLCLVAGTPGSGKADREYFMKRMNEVEYRKHYFALLQRLGANYWMEIAGERKPIDSFAREDAVWEFTQTDQWMFYTFTIGMNYSISSVELSRETIATNLLKELDKLSLLYHQMKTP
jgi:HKD family nuclease